ncbi:MAG: hypothetical protein LBH85_02250, partial [Treponema sp.]|nr:hypothetical protein [Treponema sp.]
TRFDRKTVRPGDFAFDTAARRGHSASGRFCEALAGTSPYSGWVEKRALLNGADKRAAEVIEGIRASPSFPHAGGHYDNYVEFADKPFLERRLARHIRAGRSRPRRKNDNCFAERRNCGVARETEVYKCLCPLYNYWHPSFRLADKEKQADGRRKKSMKRSPGYPASGCLNLPRRLRKARRSQSGGRASAIRWN